jgi:hypothetical protein
LQVNHFVKRRHGHERKQRFEGFEKLVEGFTSAEDLAGTRPCSHRRGRRNHHQLGVGTGFRQEPGYYHHHQPFRLAQAIFAGPQSQRISAVATGCEAERVYEEIFELSQDESNAPFFIKSLSASQLSPFFQIFHTKKSHLSLLSFSITIPPLLLTKNPS